jgi:hypothetical protein
MIKIAFLKTLNLLFTPLEKNLKPVEIKASTMNTKTCSAVTVKG